MLPNKILLWCCTRSSNLLRHLHKGFLPAACSLPVPGYMFGRALFLLMPQQKLPEHKDSLLEYNEFTVYDPKQIFAIAVLDSTPQ
ncbi:hypothetical protein REPUB_Repub05bG0150300 [Reevesia pubescens]